MQQCFLIHAIRRHGMVYKAIWRKNDVAAKVLKLPKRDPNATQAADELLLLTYFSTYFYFTYFSTNFSTYLLLY